MTQVVDIVSAENLPAAQLRHVEAPALGKYLPAIQAVHVSDCSIENVPATQVVHVVAPELERVPASQPWHVAAPAVLENLPAGQLKHVFTEEAPVAAEYVPAVQLLAHALAPASEENLPAAQLTQTSTEEAPATVAYLPATHDTHKSGEDAQREPRCLPAGQAVQLEEPAASA